jgi:hypothetical protein
MHYKFIDLPNLNLIAERILKHTPDDYKQKDMYKTLPVDFFTACKPLVDAVETIKPWSDIFSIGMITVKPHSKLPIHTDLGQVMETKYALNIPIYNCEKPYTVFYRPKDNIIPREAFQEHGDSFTHYRDDEVIEIGRMHLYKAAFFNTQIPHGIVNPTDESRIIISLRSKTSFI